ncbi:beta strand repeat-containing protein, partial [Pedobacter frigidisoli]|uniref:beta strand repeat-containing protein n=1 Tax=Pedobacter frigidisoli TaxID=2530455 RepID=UPI003977306C
SITGKTPAGADVTDVSGTTETNDTPTVATITPAGAVTLVKTVNGSVPNKAGEVLNYDLVVKNIGNVTLSNLVVIDANAIVTGSLVSSLAPGASVTLTAAHTLTQGDVDAGTYSNTATVTGKTPAGADVTDVSGTTETNDIPTVATITPGGAVTLVKSVNGSIPTAIGGVLNYNLVVKNTGNVTLTNLVVTDANAIVTGSPVASLTPGASVTLTASHTLIQSDVDAGTYTNTATVTGKTPAGADVTDVSGTTETNDTPTLATIIPVGGVTLVKTINGSVPNKAGEELNYNLVVRNTGNVTLTNLVVTDANAIVTGSPVSTLAPGASVTLTAVHTLTQVDVDAGIYTNTASITGKTPAGLDVTDVSGTTETNDTPTLATITPAGSVTLVKTINGSVPTVVGGVLNYDLIIKNTGNVTLINLVITDANAVLTGSPVSSLAPGASITLTASHTLTQSDIDAGTYSNTATVTGKTPAGADVNDISGTTETNDTPTLATITAAGSVTLVKTINGSVPTAVGGVLNYNLVIKNTGNVTLTNLVVTDANAVVTGSPVASLAPGGNVTLTAVHILTQADIDAGTYSNTATVTGKTPAGADVSDLSGTTETNDTPTVATIPPAGSVTLVKSVNGSVPNKAGEVLNYNLVVKNTGNVTLTNLAVSDANAVVTGSPVSSLAPGASVT